MASFSVFYIIAVTETWLSPVVEDSLIALPNYNLFRHDRNMRGGGVALYIHNTLSVKILSTSNTVWTGQPGYPEYLFCEVTPCTGNPIFIAVVYRLPKAPFYSGTDFVTELNNICHNYSTKRILGDFNSDQLVPSADAVVVANIMEMNSLSLVPHGTYLPNYSGTHHTTQSDTWIALCLVDQLDTVVEY